MRIAIFSNAYLPSISGVVNSITLFRKGLIAAGHEVHVFAPEYEEYEDEEPYIFRFPAIDLSGQVGPDWSGQKCFRLDTPSDVRVTELEGLPGEFSLSQNYPNPFNPTTTMYFDVPHSAHVTVTVYNVLGQQITTLVDQQMPPGKRHSVDWDGRATSGNQVASGIYFYKMEADNFVETKKMMMLK